MTTTDAGVRDDVVTSQAYAVRFGALLRRHRRAQRLRLKDVAAGGRGQIDASDLRAVERGRRRLDVPLLEQLAALYGLDVPELVPDHRAVVVDLGRGELRIADAVIGLPDASDPRVHLERYVRLVNRLREHPMRSPATLREDDTVALAEAFRLDTDEVVALLADAIGQEAAARRKLATLRAGGGTLALVVVVGAAATALPSQGDGRTGSDESPATDEISATIAEPDETAGAAETTTDDAADAEPAPIPDSSTVDGPHPPAPDRGTGPAPDQDAAEVQDSGEAQGSDADSADEPARQPAEPSSSSASSGGSSSAEPSTSDEVEDETGIDAPGGPTVIEGDEPDEVDETEIDAPGGPTVIERDESEVDDTGIDASEDGPVVIEGDEPDEVDETEIDASDDGPTVIERED